MALTSTINLRIDSVIKTKAQKVVEGLGLDLSSAIKEFLNKVIETKGIPFILSNKGRMYDPKFIKMIKEETDWAAKHGKRYNSAKEMFDDIIAK